MKHLSLPANLLLLAFSVSAAGPRPDAKLDQVLSNMQREARSIKTIQAKLDQVKRLSQIGGKETYTGKIAFKHEGERDKARIQYTDPNGALTQDVLVDGERIILYQPRIHQAIVTTRKAQAAKNEGCDFIVTPYSTTESLKARYNAAYLRDEGLAAVIELTPKGKSCVSKLTLWVDQSSWLPLKYEVVEHNGDVSIFTLSDVKKNEKLPGKIFDLKLPSDTKIITQ